MKPSDKQNLTREKLKQNIQKKNAAWTKVQAVVEMETPEEKDLREANAALAILRMFPDLKSKKEKKSEERRRKIKSERRERKLKRRRAVEKAREYVRDISSEA